MQQAHYYKRNSTDTKRFPKSHVLLVAIISCGMLLTYLALPPSSSLHNNRVSIPLKIDLTSVELADNTPEIEQRSSTRASKSTTPIQKNSTSFIVRDGDTLSKILQQTHVPRKVSSAFLKQHKDIFSLLKKDQELIFKFDNSSSLETIRYIKSPIESYTFTKSKQGFKKKVITRSPDIRDSNYTITLNGALTTSLKRSKIYDNSIRKQIQQAFKGHINFQKHAKKGDNIHILLEEKYIDGQRIGYGNVLAAKFEGKKHSYTAYRYKNKYGKVAYYNPKVTQRYKKSKKYSDSSFLRSPLKRPRITSHFSHNRLHPILKTRRPHKGTDYGAKRGTPVMSTAEGRVSRSGYSRSNGNFVVIQHGGKFTTKYLHLHNRYASKGQYVARGQKIGTVGSTGLAKGAHLHYEFLVNGVHKNPVYIGRYTPKTYTTVKVAIATPGAIPRDERKRFLQQTKRSRVQFLAGRDNNNTGQFVSSTNNKTDHTKS
jgi:murein DD-endopeptidase MepM/ murein hydrolase activator NlpD